jgi:hypothetical protein
MLRHLIYFLLLGLTLASVSVAEDAVPDAAPPAVVAPATTPPVATPAAQPAIQPGHSLHGEVFDEGPRQKAYLMSNTGKVNFPTSSKVPECQQFINQGVGQLHGFWYFEAERSFRQAAALDPNCAIAYWGMAMSNTNNENFYRRSRETQKGFDTARGPVHRVPGKFLQRRSQKEEQQGKR